MVVATERRRPQRMQATSKRRSKAISKEQIDRLRRTIETAKPLLKKPTLEVLESRFTSNGWSNVRRSAMAVLAVAGTKLIQQILEDRATAEAFSELDVQIRQYLSFLNDQSDLLKIASMRCILALCYRKDFHELQIAAAQRARKKGRGKGSRCA